MRNMLLIAKREYLEQIRGRAFRISTVLVPVVLIGLLSVSAFTGRKMGHGQAHCRSPRTMPRWPTIFAPIC